MPIINFVFSEEEAKKVFQNNENLPPHRRAHNLRVSSTKYSDKDIWLYDTHVGYCIRDYERNGYDDSDFYMTYWNPVTNKPEDICFASTRGWTYPSYGSRMDATPDIQKKYEDYIAYQRKYENVMRKLSVRKEYWEIVKKNNLPSLSVVEKIRNVFPGENWSKVKVLLTSNLRSQFRISIKNQIINWALDENPKYKQPLSNRQMNYL